MPGFLLSLVLMLCVILECGASETYVTKENKSISSQANAVKKKNTGKKVNNSGKKVTNTTKTSNGIGKVNSSAEAKKKQQETQKEIQQTEAQIKENEIKVSRGLAELGKIDGEISKTRATIGELNVELGKLNGEIKGLETNITSNENELSRLREEYLKAVKRMRVTKKNRNDLAFIFSSKTMNQALRRMRYLKEFSKWKDQQSTRIKDKIEVLQKEKETLASKQNERKEALALQKKSEDALREQHSKQEAVVAELKKNGKALESHLKKKQAEAKELGALVSQLIAEEQRKAEEARRAEEARKAEELRLAEERRKAEEARKASEIELAKKEKKEDKVKASKPAQKNKTDKDTQQKPGKGDYASARKRTPRSETITEATDFSGMKGKLPKPTNGSFVVTSHFGRQYMDELPDVEYENPGIDAESDRGAMATAVYKGKVSGVYLLQGYNTVVIVNHGNYYTVYGNISSPTVKTGDAVDMGSNLGTLAMNDEDTAHSQIHFEVWKNREKLNPEEWIKR